MALKSHHHELSSKYNVWLPAMFQLMGERSIYAIISTGQKLDTRVFFNNPFNSQQILGASNLTHLKLTNYLMGSKKKKKKQVLV